MLRHELSSAREQSIWGLFHSEAIGARCAFSLTGHYLAGPRQFRAVEPGVEGGRLLVKDFHP